MCPSRHVVAVAWCSLGPGSKLRPQLRVLGAVGSSSGTGSPRNLQFCERQPRRPSPGLPSEWRSLACGDSGSSGALCASLSGPLAHIRGCGKRHRAFPVTETSLVWGWRSPCLSENAGSLLDQQGLQWGTVSSSETWAGHQTTSGAGVVRTGGSGSEMSTKC